MKKLILLLIALIAISLLFTGGCKNSSTSSNNDNDNDNESLDETDFNYYMAIFNKNDYNKEDNYMIYVYKEKGDEIYALTVSINGENYEMYHEPYYEGWLSSESIRLNPGQNYSFAIDINDNQYSKTFSMSVPYKAFVQWPETLNLEESTQFNWTLQADAMYQEFSGYAHNAQPNEEASNYKILDTSERSYKMPANWLPNDYNDYSLTLTEISYYKDGKNFLAVAGEEDEMDYYSKKNHKEISLSERINFIKKAVHNIK